MAHQNNTTLFGWCEIGAFRICGILPSEEMEPKKSTESVIRRNSTPSGKQVRECGVRYLCAMKISLAPGSFLSALPQYLASARYANPRSRTTCYALGSVLCEAQKKIGTHIGVPIFFGDSYGNRTHVFSVRG